MIRRRVFVTGGTGYLGQPLIRELLARGHGVRALVRPGCAAKVPEGAEAVSGDALGDFAATVPPSDTLVHLVGTSHPGPHKAREFREVDLVSIKASIAAGKRAAIRHLVYVSVAHPAPAMHAYIAVRKEGEVLIAASGLPATVLRPWYVLGPGRRWPGVLVPVYRLMEIIPWTRESALRLGLVRLSQMTAALVFAVENPVAGVRFAGVPEIRDATGVVMSDLYEFSAKTLGGGAKGLGAYRGKVVLVVNTASECGFTPQYEGLEAVSRKYREKGLEVLGFPCNQFGAQEPGDAAEIGAFCQKNYDVSFQMFDKIEVNGSGAHPLYKWLTGSAPGILGIEAIKWNFTKFLVGRDGKVFKRYAPQTKPEAISGDIEQLLAA